MMKAYETEEFQRRSERSIDILYRLKKGELGPQEAYDALIKNGSDPATIVSSMYEWLGGKDSVCSPEVAENNRKISERLDSLVEVPKPNFDYLQFRNTPEEEISGSLGNPEDHLFHLIWKLVNGKISAEEALQACKEAGAPEEETRAEIELILSQMRAADEKAANG